MTIQKNYRLPERCLNKAHYLKKYVTWHFDAASSVSATYATFLTAKNKKGQPEKKGTPFCIARDGTIYELYNPFAYWTWHTGTSDEYYDSRSIGIEIENVGPLVVRNGYMCWWPDKYTRRYCKVSDTKMYWDFGKMWRNHRFWATYTPHQLDSVNNLSNHLSRAYGISRVLPQKLAPEKLTVEEIAYNKTLPMIAHHHVRNDKVDLGPLFPFEAIVD